MIDWSTENSIAVQCHNIQGCCSRGQKKAKSLSLKTPCSQSRSRGGISLSILLSWDPGLQKQRYLLKHYIRQRQWSPRSDLHTSSIQDVINNSERLKKESFVECDKRTLKTMGGVGNQTAIKQCWNADQCKPPHGEKCAVTNDG
jgi:hypothetical protein